MMILFFVVINFRLFGFRTQLRELLRTQLITQFLLQLATWRVVSSEEKMVGPYGFKLPSLTTRHVASCGKSCVRSCGPRIAPQLTHLAQKLKN